MSATISDVARHANVSAKTASRVINNEPHVRQQLRDRVNQAVRALDYNPNLVARQLAGSRSSLLVFFCEDPRSRYVAGIQAGAIRRTQELGLSLVVEMIENHRRDGYAAVERVLKSLQPGGAVLLPPLSDNLELVAILEGLAIRTVRVAAANRDTGSHVFSNEKDAGRAITEHLIEIGHRSIGIVRGHPDHHAALERFDGYLQAMQSAGLTVEPDWVAQGYFDMQSGIAAGRAILASRRPPTAIFATNDDMAVGVMLAARDRGIDVPGALSVAGFDDSQMGRSMWPSLTSIRQPLKELGQAAIGLLMAPELNGSTLELPYDLQFRASTAPPPR